MKNFCAGIHVLIKKKNRFLVLKRSPGDIEDAGYWDLPGGGINFGEQPFQASLREAKEEAGILITINRIFGLWGEFFGEKWSIESIVLADYARGKVILSKEHSDFKWVTKKELVDILPKSENLKALFRYTGFINKYL